MFAHVVSCPAIDSKAKLDMAGLAEIIAEKQGNKLVKQVEYRPTALANQIFVLDKDSKGIYVFDRINLVSNRYNVNYDQSEGKGVNDKRVPSTTLPHNY